MPAGRPTWSGFLKLNLVTVPLKAFPATITAEGDIHLNQLHADCGSRIKYQKTCPIHGEVSQDSIVSGYEYAKGQYVVVEEDEVDKLRPEEDRAIRIDKFIKPGTLDGMYQDDKSYYLLPDGPVAQQAYAVVQEAIKQDGVVAIATVVWHGHDQMVMVRPVGRLLLMTMLKHDAEVRKPSEIEEFVPAVAVSEQEVEMARTVMRSQEVEKLDYSQFRDHYRDKLKALIDAKVAGQEIVAAPAAPAQVINLMDALKQSVEKAKSAVPEKPAKKMAGTSEKKSASKKKA
jgi:DNA end-binding protein Ku